LRRRKKNLEAKKDRTPEEDKRIKEIGEQSAEVLKRCALIEELKTKYDQHQHDRQFQAYKQFVSKDGDRQLGYEVSVELNAYNSEGIERPAAKFYLVETLFEGEK
jgi:hypothetical protein